MANLLVAPSPSAVQEKEPEQLAVCLKDIADGTGGRLVLPNQQKPTDGKRRIASAVADVASALRADRKRKHEAARTCC